MVIYDKTHDYRIINESVNCIHISINQRVESGIQGIT